MENYIIVWSNNDKDWSSGVMNINTILITSGVFRNLGGFPKLHNFYLEERKILINILI